MFSKFYLIAEHSLQFNKIIVVQRLG